MVMGVDLIQHHLECLYSANFIDFIAFSKQYFSIEDRQVKCSMDSSVRMVGGHYEIAVLKGYK